MLGMYVCTYIMYVRTCAHTSLVHQWFKAVNKLGVLSSGGLPAHYRFIKLGFPTSYPLLPISPGALDKMN